MVALWASETDNPLPPDLTRTCDNMVFYDLQLSICGSCGLDGMQ